MAAAVQNLLPGVMGVDEQHVHAVLKLVPKADGSAALVQTAPALDTAGDGLIGGPAVHIGVQRRVGRADLQPVQQSGPAGGGGGQGGQRQTGAAKLADLRLAAAAADQHGDVPAGTAQQHGGGGKIAFDQGRGGAAGPKLHAGQIGLRVFRPENAVLCAAAHAAAVGGAQNERQGPAQLPIVSALHNEHPGVDAAGDEGTGLDEPAADLLFPHRKAGRKADPAEAAVVGGEETDRPLLRLQPQALAAGDALGQERGLVYPHFPGVFQPHAAAAAVGGDIAVAAVGQDELPGAEGEIPVYIKRKGPARVPVFGDAAEGPGRAESRRGRLRQGSLLPPHRISGPAFDQRLCAQGGKVYPAGTVDQSLKGEAGKDLADPAEEGPLILALLVAEIHKVRVETAAFQQTEAQKQALRLLCSAVAAEDGQVAGDAEGPQFPGGSGLMEPGTCQLRQHVHGRADLPGAEPQQRGGSAQHTAAVQLGGGQYPLRALFGLLLRETGAEGKAQRGGLPGAQTKVQPGRDQRFREPAQTALFIGGKLGLPAAGQTQPKLPRAAPAHPAQQQAAALRFGKHP